MENLLCVIRKGFLYEVTIKLKSKGRKKEALTKVGERILPEEGKKCARVSG